jgi:hypothetical protein
MLKLSRLLIIGQLWRVGEAGGEKWPGSLLLLVNVKCEKERTARYDWRVDSIAENALLVTNLLIGLAIVALARTMTLLSALRKL